MKSGTVDNNPQIRVDMCRQLASALNYVHSIPIIHRDVHPGNVLVQPGPTLKLSDFGLAKDVTYNSVRSVVGVPDFMAPEVIGESYGPPADIFSLGVVFICVITLNPNMRDLFERPPWSAVADSEVRFLNRVSQFLTESDLLNLFPILERMLRHNPAERCSAEQVADFFDTLLIAQ
jgi:serine/threonine protein kinase